MELHPSITQEWPFLLTLLPDDLETSARELGALQRKREVRSAADLLRLALVYGFCGLSLRETCTWAQAEGIADLSPPALLKRLVQAGDWLGRLVWQQLTQRAACSPAAPEGGRLRLVDATGVNRPGSQGTDFRLHVGFDLGTLTLDAVEVTTEAGGETFKRFEIAPGEIVIGDGGYTHRPGMAAVLAAGGELIVRHNWYNLVLQHRDGTPFALWETVRSLGATEVGEWEVETAPGKQKAPALPGRLIVLRKSPQAAEAARRKVRQQARKKGETPSAQKLEAAEYGMLFVTLAAERLSAEGALELYRFRWQVELAFKRMKSLLALDEMTARRDGLGRSFLLGKLLGALLVEGLSHRWVDFSPWGYRCGAAGVGVAGVSDGGGDGAARDRWGAAGGAVGGVSRAVATSLPRHAA